MNEVIAFALDIWAALGVVGVSALLWLVAWVIWR